MVCEEADLLTETERTAGTVLRLAAAACERDPAGAWLGDGERSLTRAACARRIGACAANLAAAGVRPGDHVALLLPNTPDAVICWLGVMHAGAVAVPLNPSLTTSELARILVHCSASLVIADGEGGLAVAPPDGAWPPIVSSAHLLAGNPAPLAAPTVQPHDPATVLYSSGTTGLPKGVVLPHRALVLAAEATAHALAADASDVFLTTNPLFHVNAVAYAVLASLAVDARVVVLPRFSSSGLMGMCQQTGATVLVLAAAAIPMWWERLKGEQPAANAIRAVLTGGAPPDIFTEVEAHLGARIHTGYALTESPLGLLAPRPGTGERRPSPGLGLPPVHPDPEIRCEAMIADDQGRPLPAGAHGEIFLRNPARMKGYLNDDAATVAMLHNGWLKTGDIGYRDGDGYFYFVSRRKEMLRRKGEMVSPAEIEAVLRGVPGVRDAAVVGEASGLGVGEERIVAFVEIEPDAQVSVQTVRDICGSLLAAHKQPDDVVIRGSFPRNAMDKVQKNRLLAEARSRS